MINENFIEKIVYTKDKLEIRQETPHRRTSWLQAFDLVQHVTGATHKFGGTITFDFIITGSDVAIESVEVDPPSSQTTVWCPVVYAYSHMQLEV